VHHRKLLVLALLSASLGSCKPCLTDACTRNEFEVRVAWLADGGRSGDEIVAASVSGPCKLNLQRTDCDLAAGCEAFAVTATGEGTCHVTGSAKLTGPFSTDVVYRSCSSECGGTSFVTDGFDLVLGPP
jgi:hypothetical protein